MLAITEDDSTYTQHSSNVVVTNLRHEADVKGYDDLAIVQNGCCPEQEHVNTSIF